MRGKSIGNGGFHGRVIGNAITVTRSFGHFDRFKFESETGLDFVLMVYKNDDDTLIVWTPFKTWL